MKLLFVGGDFRRKGGDLVLDIFRDRLADRCELDIVTGPDLTGAEDIPNVRVHRGLKPNTDGLRALYQNADIFLLPTRGDCMPFVILEAAAAGLPVVTTALGAIPEMVQDGVTGFVVPPMDVALLQRRIVELIEQPELRRQMGQAARAPRRSTVRRTPKLRHVAGAAQTVRLSEQSLPRSMPRPLRIIYSAGPGDVIRTYRHWRRGRMIRRSCR